ncbi:DNA damage-binding protein 1a [Leucoagaricus sp. SymC.cos]|nr:DNA damage-binding protein 1a [Leucoagaricus sp. SymC.cos]
MKIVTTFHQPSSTLTSLKCRLSTRDVEHLVVAKLNRIEVYSLQPSGVKLECSREIYGKVASVKAIPILNSTRSNLVVLLAHPDPELLFLSYAESEDSTAELQPTHQLSLYERTLRTAEFCNDILVHPSGKLAVVSCYIGKLKIINLKAGRYQDDFDASLPELNIFSLSFLPLPDDEYALAILHFDHQQRIQLLARDIELRETQLSTFPSTRLHSTVISDKIFPYPLDSPPKLVPVFPSSPLKDEDDTMAEQEGHFLGGILVVGGRKLLLYELVDEEGQEKQRGKRKRLEDKKKSKDPLEKAKAREREAERESKRRKPRANVVWPWSDINTWCSIDGEPTKFVLGDAYGKLALLSLDNLQDLGLVLIPLGEVSPPTSLTYLTNQIVYVGSHMGDSQLVQLSPTPTSSIDQPTLPIPEDIHTVSSSSIDGSVTKKGKGRAISPTFDNMEIDDEAGDPQESGKLVATKGSYVTVLEQFKNIAPIVDACLVDIAGGQRQLVTCSGGKNAGSLNVVRNGADLQEFVHIPDLQHVLKIWGVRSRLEDSLDSFLLLSFYDSSRLIRINDNGGRLSFSPLDAGTVDGLCTSEPTIAFSNVAQRIKGQDGKARYVDSSLAVQVTGSGAYLLELDESLQTYMHVDRWDVKANAPGEANVAIVAASINSSQVALAVSGGKMVLLSINEHRKLRVVVSTMKSIRLPEISAISCTPLNPMKAFSQYVLVSYWDSNTIEVFIPSETGFKSIHKTSSLPSLVTSLLFYNFGSDQSSKGTDYHPYLLAGLGDGSVATFAWQDHHLKDRKIISLGHAPVSLVVSKVDLGLGGGTGVDGTKGKDGNSVRTVLAAGNRAIVFAHERNRLIHSPILAKNIVAASPVNSLSLPSSLIIASEEGLHIGKIKDLNKLHIRSIPFGLDNPRRAAYHPLLKAFGVVFTRTEPARIGDEELISSFVKLIDDSTFEVLATFNCDINEEITSIIATSALVDDVVKPFFVVGTFLYNPEQTEPDTGRLLLLSVSTISTNNPRSPKQVYELSLMASTQVKGCVYALSSKGGIGAEGEQEFIAAVNSSIMLFKLQVDTDISPSGLKISKLTEWNHNYLVTSLGAVGKRVFAGDQISSVSLLSVEGGSFQTVARDYGPTWPISVEAIDEKNVIGANDALNLFTFTLSRNLNRNVLECSGNYHLADLVTKLIRGSLTAVDHSEESILEPEGLLFTSSGRIGVIVDVKTNVSLHLTELQRNMTAVIPSVGGTSHARFRAPKSTRGRSDADQASFGFLDGDFMEQLLTLLDSPDVIQKIWKGQSEPEKMSVSVDEIRRLLEDLQSYH